MLHTSKKMQIINSYIEDILPYLEYQKIGKNSISGELKIGDTHNIDSKLVEKYVSIGSMDKTRLELDFTNSSIKDVYKALSLINKSILLG